MDFALTDDQQLLMTSFEGLLDRYRALPVGEHGYCAYNPGFQRELEASGFLDIASQPGFGLLEAALLTEAAASCPLGAELAWSAMLAPILGGALSLAVVWDAAKPVRYLADAQFFLLIEDDRVVFEKTATCRIRRLDGVAAYPMAVFEQVYDGHLRVFTGAQAAAIRRRALIGIAAEAAGLMRGALDLTVQYVKDRQQFGQPLGHFQAVQHRLADCAMLIEASRALALRAAWADDATLAATACLHAQTAMRQVIHDCHQFTGAMGLTLEYPLHLFTYRLKILQGEAGGVMAQSAALADLVWAFSGQGSLK